MRRSEIKQRVIDELTRRLPPEKFAEIIASGIDEKVSRPVFDAKTGEMKTAETGRNWAIVRECLSLVHDIWGTAASKQLEDVTNKNFDGFTAEQIEERRALIFGRGEGAGPRLIDVGRSGDIERKTLKSKDRSKVSV